MKFPVLGCGCLLPFLALLLVPVAPQLAPTANDNHVLTLGLLLSWQGDWPVSQTFAPAILEAVQRVKDDAILPDDWELTWAWDDTKCRVNDAVSAVMTLFNYTKPDVIIGPACSINAERIAPLSLFWDTPVISWSAASAALSDKVLYPTFVRTLAPWSVMSPSFYSFMQFTVPGKKPAWNKLAIVASTETLFETTVLAVAPYLRNKGVKVDVYRYQPVTSANLGAKTAILQDVKKSGTRIVLMFGYCGDMREYALSAMDLGMQAAYAHFVFVFPSSCAAASTGGMPEDGRDEDAKKAFAGFINIAAAPNTAEAWTSFTERVRTTRATFDEYVHPPNGPAMKAAYRHPLTDGPYLQDAADVPMDIHGGFLYDGILLYAHAVKFVLAEGGNPRDTQRLLAVMKNDITFEGISGFVDLDDNGDRAQAFAFSGIDEEGFSDGVPIAWYDQRTEQTHYNEKLFNAFVWPGRLSYAPTDSPEECKVVGQVVVSKDSEGNLQCENCPPGFYSDNPAATSCSQCPLGTFSSESGRSSCENCNPGTFANMTGMSSCEACSKGSFSSTTASTECSPCVPGKFQNDVGQAKCQSCNPRFFAPQNNSVACVECPPNSDNFQTEFIIHTLGSLDNFVSNNAADCFCKPGFYGNPWDVNGCVACPNGGLCCDCREPVDVQETYFHETGILCDICLRGSPAPVPQKGYVVSLPTNEHGSDRPEGVEGGVIVSCLNPDACTGGLNSSCADGYKGRRCGICNATHYKLGVQCYECKDYHLVLLLLTFLLVPFIIWLSIWVTVHHLRLSSAIILINLLQVVALIQLYPLNWPAAVTDFMNLASFLNFNVELLALECYFGSPSYFPRIFIWIAMPVFFGCLFASVWLIMEGVKRVLDFRYRAMTIEEQEAFDAEEKHGFTMLLYQPVTRFNVLIGAYLLFLLAAYTAVTIKMMEMFLCKENEDGSFSIVAAPATTCYDAVWFSYVPASILGFILYSIGIPVVMAFICYRHKEHLRPSATDKEQSEIWRWRLGAVVESYNPEHLAWDVVDMVRSAVIIVCPAMFKGSPRMASFVGLTAIMAYLLLEVRMAPFIYSPINRVDMLTDLAAFFMLLAGVYFYSYKTPEEFPVERGVLEGIVIFYVVACLVVLIFIIGREGQNVWSLKRVRERMGVLPVTIDHTKLRRSSVVKANRRRMSLNTLHREVPDLFDALKGISDIVGTMDSEVGSPSNSELVSPTSVPATPATTYHSKKASNLSVNTSLPSSACATSVPGSATEASPAPMVLVDQEGNSQAEVLALVTRLMERMDELEMQTHQQAPVAAEVKLEVQEGEM